MANMARINDGTVVEVLKPIDGFDISDCFHPDILADCVPCGDDVQPGWIVTEDGIVAPEPAPEPEPEPEEEAPPATE
jgi:hypothetical protein